MKNMKKYMNKNMKKYSLPTKTVLYLIVLKAI
jgi:hypothetical protein